MPVVSATFPDQDVLMIGVAQTGLREIDMDEGSYIISPLVESVSDLITENDNAETVTNHLLQRDNAPISGSFHDFLKKLRFNSLSESAVAAIGLGISVLIVSIIILGFISYQRIELERRRKASIAKYSNRRSNGRSLTNAASQSEDVTLESSKEIDLQFSQKQANIESVHVDATLVSPNEVDQAVKHERKSSKIEIGSIREIFEPWIPQQSDELVLTAGDRIVILSIFHDGWCEGKLLNDNEVKGIFPLQCLRDPAALK